MREFLAHRRRRFRLTKPFMTESLSVQSAAHFGQVGRIPAPGDNAAIAVRRLEAGTEIAHDGAHLTLRHTVLEGHRFAPVPVAAGQSLFSWGLPFGVALCDIAPGDYVCNEKILAELRQRHPDFALPDAPNFQDLFVRHQLDERTFRPGHQVPRHPQERFFDGYDRGRRGVGTRNFIAVLGTTSLTAGYARALAERFKDVRARYHNIDGVVAVAHTEGGGASRPNNFELLLRTLAGFLVNPNIGAVLAVDSGGEVVNNAMLQRYLIEHHYPLDNLAHRFLSLQGNFQSALAQGETIVQSWLEPVNGCARSPQSLAHLKIGLQCGGSDAFSGVSGNPLAGWITKELVRYGGSANLAETDELIGAEPYVLSNVRDLATVRAFLRTLERFEELAECHGSTAQSNPSGGNMYRGLYNITIKSIGAARKKDPAVRLDYVIDYGQRMDAPGFYFMDSPGNDLESVAGQVAAGCNLILFTTGNGSITNFPFVPTIKVMTSSGRFNLLAREMDLNAGRYLDGTPMEVLGKESFEYTVRIASGVRSAGEKAGHSQVQIWREWRQTSPDRVAQIQRAPKPGGDPLRVRENPTEPTAALTNPHFRYRPSPIGLIVPTSLCAGEIAKLIATRLNREGGPQGLRYVALAHTEGCGVSSGESEQLFLRTMAGYLRHPLVARRLLLEHGCEKTHNDAMRNFLREQGFDQTGLGWASVQLDGGIEKVTAKVMNWFQTAAASKTSSPRDAGLEVMRLGLTAVGPVPATTAAACAGLARLIVNAGGTMVVPQNASLLASVDFCRELFVSPDSDRTRVTLAYGQTFTKAGFHIMETPTDHQVETLTGLGATGVETFLAHVSERPLQAHPMIPLLQISSLRTPHSALRTSDDLDLLLDVEGKTPALLLDELLGLLARVAAGEYTPKLFAQGNTDFQMTRGWLGVSL